MENAILPVDYDLIVSELIIAFPVEAAIVREEKPDYVTWFVGQAMKASGGKGSPITFQRKFMEKLS